MDTKKAFYLDILRLFYKYWYDRNYFWYRCFWYIEKNEMNYEWGEYGKNKDELIRELEGRLLDYEGGDSLPKSWYLKEIKRTILEIEKFLISTESPVSKAGTDIKKAFYLHFLKLYYRYWHDKHYFCDMCQRDLVINDVHYVWETGSANEDALIIDLQDNLSRHENIYCLLKSQYLKDIKRIMLEIEKFLISKASPVLKAGVKTGGIIRMGRTGHRMSTKERVINKLCRIMNEENQKPLYVLGGYIVGLLIADNNKKITNLIRTSPALSKIADYASELEINNGNAIGAWEQIKVLITSLSLKSGNIKVRRRLKPA